MAEPQKPAAPAAAPAKPVAPAAPAAPPASPLGAMEGPLVDSDNAAPGYAAYRSDASTDDLLSQARARMAATAGQGAAPGAATPGAPAPTAVTPAGEAPKPVETPGAGSEPPGVAAPTPGEGVHADGGANPAPGEPPLAPGRMKPQPGADFAKLGAAAKDIAGGIPEIPQAFWGGLQRAAAAAYGGALDFAAWAGEKSGEHGVTWGWTPEQQAAMVQKVKEFSAAVKGAPDADSALAAGRPDTVSGNIVSGAVQFLSFASRASAAFKALGAAPAAANAAGGVTSAIAAFQGAEDSLAEWIQSNPKTANFVTEFLASKPDDNEAVKRLKNGIEGLVGESLFAGLFRSLRFIQAGRDAGIAVRPQEGALPAPSKVLQPELKPDALKILGDGAEDATAPIVQLKPAEKPAVDPKVQAKLQEGLDASAGTDAGAAAKGLATDAQANRLSAAFGAPVDLGNQQVAINFARINTPADVQTALGQMTEAFAGKIDDAARGVRSNEVTKQAADDLGMSVADLLRRRNGQPLNAEEGLAARNLWVASGQKLLETAQAAAAPGATAADLYAFRKMMATHYAIQAEVLGARAEAGRALQAWSIPAGGGQEQMKALETMLQGSGGPDVSKAMAQRLALLAESGADPATLNQAIRKGAFAKTMDAVKEIWINGLLSSPTTHIVNTASNLNVAMQQVGERYVAGKIAKLTGSGGVADGEAQAMMYGLMTGMQDATRAAWRSMRGLDPASGTKLEAAHEPAVSAAAFNLDQAGGAGRFVDFIGHVFRVPGKALETQDAFFKSIGYRMELHAQAYRQAASEGLEGAALGQRVAEIVSNPPENIRLASADAALYNTFTNETGEFGKKLMSLRNGGGALNPLPFIIPFVRTPINIARYSFERTPLAPLVGQWRADIAAGGARRDIALARMATGSAAMTIAADYAMQGLVSGKGPADAAERETMQRNGWKPYSIKIGDKWYSYNRTDPFGQTLGFAADLTEAMKRGEIDPADVDEWNEMAAAGIAAVSQFTVNKTYLQGLAEFANVMTDPERYGRGYIDQMASSFLPFTGAAGAVERMVDPTQREVFTPMDAVQSKLAGLSEKLIPSRDLWGEERRAGGAVMPGTAAGQIFDALTPVQVSQEKHAPIDDEMLKQRVFQQRIGKKSGFAGVDVDWRQWPEVYDAYVQLAGNGAKDPAWNMGAKDFLDAVVSGKHELSKIYELYSDGPDGGKARFIKNTIINFRQLAQRQILDDPKFAAFAEFVAREQGAKNQQRMPQVQ